VSDKKSKMDISHELGVLRELIEREDHARCHTKKAIEYDEFLRKSYGEKAKEPVGHHTEAAMMVCCAISKLVMGQTDKIANAFIAKPEDGDQ
jgi:hypothetical protein